MNTLYQLDRIQEEKTYFCHPGMVFDREKYKIEFSKEAQISLWNEVERLKQMFPLSENTSKVLTEAMGQEVVDLLIQKNKSDEKIKSLWKKVQKLLKKESEQIPKKIEQNIENSREEPSLLLYLDVGHEAYEKDQVPIIIRKNSTLESLLHSFSSRLAFAGNHKYKNLVR